MLFFKLNKDISKAAEAVLNDQVICFPTETVMGLGVRYDSKYAYQRLNFVKCRPDSKPYTMMVSSVDEIKKYAILDVRAEKIIHKFVPGSITLLLKARDSVPSWVTHNTGVIGIRIPTNKEAVKLLKKVRVPLLVPSANISGHKPAIDDKEARHIFGSMVGYYVEGKAKNEKPSTIVDLTGNDLKLVREGPISLESIKKVI